jgi:hypothetical protein
MDYAVQYGIGNCFFTDNVIPLFDWYLMDNPD